MTPPPTAPPLFPYTTLFRSSVMAAARVRGFQGASLRSPDAVAATAKHFAAYGAAEGGRDYNVADVSERTLREVYLPPFHAAVCRSEEHTSELQSRSDLVCRL